MMGNKYLVVVLGNKYIKPLVVLGNHDVFLKHLASESMNNKYLYCVYVLNELHGYYVPLCAIHQGFIDKQFSARYEGIDYHV